MLRVPGWNLWDNFLTETLRAVFFSDTTLDHRELSDSYPNGWRKPKKVIMDLFHWILALKPTTTTTKKKNSNDENNNSMSCCCVLLEMVVKSRLRPFFFLEYLLGIYFLQFLTRNSRRFLWNYAERSRRCWTRWGRKYPTPNTQCMVDLPINLP